MVQAVLANASQPVTNTLGRVISTPESREKERRDKFIEENPNKYSIEDYKRGIKEPGADNSVLSDPIAMAAALTAGGVGLGATALSQVPRMFLGNLASEATFGGTDLIKGGLRSTNALVGNINDIMSKKYPIPEWFKEEMRFKSLPELNNPDASKVLENFRTRIGTPEGKERLKQLGITNTKVLDNLKIVGDENTLGQYWHNTIGLNPELPEVKNVTRHEIEHGVQDALEQSRLDKYNYDAGNFKYLFRPKAKKEAIQAAMKQTSDIDDILSGLELRKTPEKVDWLQLKQTQGKKDASRLFEYMSDKQKATNYFDSGSAGKEKSAFLGEVQQHMIDKGIIPSNSYIHVTPEMVKQTFIDAMFDEKTGGKHLRLFNIMKPTDVNYNLISKGLNKMLTIGVPAVIGVGALQQKKHGGTTYKVKINKPK
jgi:hypothetical protein